MKMVIRVIVADDSSYQRTMISKMISEHEKIEVIDTARNGEEAVEKVLKFQPDVLLLDLIMPKLGGLEALKRIRLKYPVPTIVFSVLDPKTLDSSVKALLLGAFDYIIKPGGIWKVELPKFKKQLISKIILAYKSKKIKQFNKKSEKKIIPDIKTQKRINTFKSEKIKYEIKENFPKPTFKNNKGLNLDIIVIGTSVGGPKTLRSILKKIPKKFTCPILIVQHLNSNFMEMFANNLNEICKLNVKVAENDEIIHSGNIYLAPGGKHMEIIRRNNKPLIRVFTGDPINFCKPSVDPLFISAARIFKNQVLGIILTGIGFDGTEGLKAIRLAGGITIAESQETCVVFGMPKVAIEKGAAEIIVPNYQIIDYMVKFSNRFKYRISDRSYLGEGDINERGNETN